MYRDHLRIYFNSVLLQRALASANGSVTDPTARAAIQTCYSSALSLLNEALKLGKMDVLYYLWDTAHLMIAFSAMVLVKILKLAPDCPGVSINKAYLALSNVADIHTSAAGSLQSQNSTLPGFVCKTSAENTVDVQARLLQAIAFRVKMNLVPQEHHCKHTKPDNWLSRD